MRISVVTTTHDRPACLQLLERWIARQTVTPWQWVVIDDGQQHADLTLPSVRVFRDAAGSVRPSLHANWMAALDLVHGDVVVPMEDDDWYHPEYLAVMVELLAGEDLVGVAAENVYHPRNARWATMCNEDNASLASTVWHRRCSDVFRSHAQSSQSVYLDVALWIEAIRRNWKRSLFLNRAADGRCLHVSLKGMPGAPGLGCYHDGLFGLPDPRRQVLTRWCGAGDARAILDVCGVE